MVLDTETIDYLRSNPPPPYLQSLTIDMVEK